MPPAWLLLRHDRLPPAENMAWDEALLEAAARLGRPLLRFYGWAEPAASFGYFQKMADVERLTALRPLVRRPTGGGVVPHDADWTYSAVWPPDDPWYSLRAIESYRRMHEWIRTAFAETEVPTELAPGRRNVTPGNCFAGAEQFDVLFHGHKLAGAAQRRTRGGLLIQGSIQPPPGSQRSRFESAMLAVAAKLEPMKSDQSNASREADDAVTWAEFHPDAGLLERVRELAQTKYSRAAFNHRR